MELNIIEARVRLEIEGRVRVSLYKQKAQLSQEEIDRLVDSELDTFAKHLYTQTSAFADNFICNVSDIQG